MAETKLTFGVGKRKSASIATLVSPFPRPAPLRSPSSSLHRTRALSLPTFTLPLPAPPLLHLPPTPSTRSIPALPLPGTLQPVLTLSAFSPHPEKYMEFDLNGNGDIGEKRVILGGSVQI